MAPQDKHHVSLEKLKSINAPIGIFFTEEGIIVDSQTHSLCLPILPLLDVLKISIVSIHLDQSIVIVKCRSAVLSKDNQYAGYTIKGIRSLLSVADPNRQLQIIRATHWMNWDNQSQYCGRCAHLLNADFNSPQKQCPQCSATYFPRFSPAVMVLIYREKEILLARSHHFTPGVYSAIAGFVDIGETAELAVHREVKEELGITVSHLEYFSSQTWPFPDSFMIAFKAQYSSGELILDPNELEDAQWFTLETLPKLPPTASIARQLIDSHRLD